MSKGLYELSLNDLNIIAELANYRSLRSLARSKKLEAPHLSKILSRVERKIDLILVRRSQQGYFITPEGLRIVKAARAIVDAAAAHYEDEGISNSFKGVVSIGSTSFLSTFLLAPTLADLRIEHNLLRFRIIEMPPDQIQISGADICDALVSIGEPKLTSTWSTTCLGDISWALFSSEFHPIKSSVEPAELRKYPFIVPTYLRGERFEIGNDYCPLALNQRIKGDETSNVLTAAELLRQSTNQLSFSPRISMQNHVNRGVIREIRVAGWKTVVRKIFLSVRSDSFSKKLETQLISSLKNHLS